MVKKHTIGVPNFPLPAVSPRNHGDVVDGMVVVLQSKVSRFPNTSIEIVSESWHESADNRLTIHPQTWHDIRERRLLRLGSTL